MDIDSISREINKTVNHRLEEIPKVKKVVKEKANEFIEWTGKQDLISLVKRVQKKLSSEPVVSNKTISETYSRYASCYGGEPGKRKELLESLVVGSFYEKIHETTIRKIISSLQTEVYASHHSNSNERESPCFMANLCCKGEAGYDRAGMQNHSC